MCVFQYLISKKKLNNDELTCDAVCDTEKTNPNNLYSSPLSSESHTYSTIAGKTSGERDRVTVKELEKQVDDLVATYNKLAETLNRPKFEENRTKQEDQSANPLTKKVKVATLVSIFCFVIFFAY